MCFAQPLFPSVSFAALALFSLACGSGHATRPSDSQVADVPLDAGNVIHRGPTDAGAGGSPATDADAGATAALDPTLACIEYMRGLCERSARCDGIPSTIEPCMSNARFCPDVMFAPGSTRTVEGTLACADEWRELPCDAVPSHPTCATPGTRAAGEPCIASMQCASHSCSTYGDTCGVCSQIAGEAEACDLAAGIDCDEGLYCSEDPQVCVALPPASRASTLALGEECDPRLSECYPNDCRRDTSDVYRCTPYPTLGQDCTVPLTCAFGDSYCDISGVCLAFPAVGAACGVDGFTGDGRWCGADGYCDDTAEPRVCRALAAPGEACVTGCVSGYRCECDTAECLERHCSRQRYPGESCDEPGDRCLVGRCEAGTCQAYEAQGLYASACEAR